MCLRVYHKPVFNQDAYLKLYFKHKRSFNSQQVCVFGVGRVCGVWGLGVWGCGGWVCVGGGLALYAIEAQCY